MLIIFRRTSKKASNFEMNIQSFISHFCGIVDRTPDQSILKFTCVLVCVKHIYVHKKGESYNDLGVVWAHICVSWCMQLSAILNEYVCDILLNSMCMCRLIFCTGFLQYLQSMHYVCITARVKRKEKLYKR